MTSLWSKILSHKDRNMIAREMGREVARQFMTVYFRAQEDDTFASLSRDEQSMSLVEDFELARNGERHVDPMKKELFKPIDAFLSEQFARTMVDFARHYAETELEQTFQFVHVVGVYALKEYKRQYPDEPTIIHASCATRTPRSI